MSMSLSKATLATRLTRHFAAGAAIAAAAPFMTADSASAAVQYTAVSWNIPANIDGLYINVETLATGSAGSAVAGWDINPYSATSLTWFNAVGTGMLRYPGVTAGSAGNLAVGTPVAGTGSFGSGAVVVGTAAGNWQLNATNYFGFRFVASDGQTHYGWGAMVVGAAITTRTITEIAWETTPLAPINVGDTGGGGTPPYDPCAPGNASASLGNNSFFIASNAADLVVGGVTYTAANYFRFTPPSTGDWTFSTCASGAATRLAILDGCTTSAAVIASNDNFCGSSSELTTMLTAGTTVYVVLGGEGAALASPQSLSVSGPGTSCATAAVASYGLNPISSSPGSGSDQTVYTNAAQTTTGVIYNAQWFSITPVATGLFTLKTCNSGDTKMAIGTACAATGTFNTIAYNDDAPTCLTGAGGQPWGSWIDATNNGATDGGFPLTQALVAGTTYFICVGGYGDTNIISGSLEIIGPDGTPYDPCRPTNPTAGPGSNTLAYDANAADLNLVGGACSFVVYGANYYKYTPTVTGSHTFDTCASSANTRMAILDGCAAGAAVLGCNDDSCGLSSSVTLDLTLSVPVYVVVGSWSSTSQLTSPVALRVTLPPDPLCVSAAPAVYGDNAISSTVNPGANPLVYTDAAQTASTQIYNAQWFAFTPTATGAFTIKACDSGDTRMAIGTTCPGTGAPFSTIAYNDDAPTCLEAAGGTNAYGSWIDATNNGATGGFAGFPLTQDLVAGTTYYICVGGFGSTNAISGFLNISGPQGSLCPADLDGDGAVGAPDLANLLGAWGGTGAADLDGDGVVGPQDLAAMLGAWGACP
jgi:hypothetical protein